MPIYLPLQRLVKRKLPNMHGQHPEPTNGPCIIFKKVPGLLRGNNARADATPLPWPTETAFVIAVDHHDDVTQAFTLKQMHQVKGLRINWV